LLGIDALRCPAQVKVNAVLLVQRAHEVTEFSAEHTFEWASIRSHDVHLEASRTQSRGDLQADETCAQDDRALGIGEARDDGAAIGQSAEREHVGLIGTWDRELHGFGSSGEEQRGVRVALTTLDFDTLLRNVDPRDPSAQHEFDLMLREELWRAERNPLFGCGSSQVILR